MLPGGFLGGVAQLGRGYPVFALRCGSFIRSSAARAALRGQSPLPRLFRANYASEIISTALVAPTHIFSEKTKRSREMPLT